MTRSRMLKSLFCLCVLIVAATLASVMLLLRDAHNRREKLSCYSHLMIIAHDFGNVMDENRVLPFASNLVSACSKVADTMSAKEKERQPTLNLVACGPGLYCPSAYKKDGSVGYVYVGEGLRLRDVRARNILILFDSFENHRGWSPVWVPYDGTIKVYTCSEMIKLLQDAIELGVSGEVPYSKRAMVILNDELSQRLAFL